MGSTTDPSKRQYESNAYQLPKDAPEHERLDAQSGSIVALMKNQPFHIPSSHRPKRILDIGCGTGVMTNLLASTYPQALVIGVDIAPVPESRHKKLDNVEFARGDIHTLIGTDARFELGSFDYIFERLLIFGISEWPKYISTLSTLLSPGGWLEAQEASMQIYSRFGDRVGDSWFFTELRSQARTALGMDIEIGRKLRDTFDSTNDLENVSEMPYRFHPVARKEHPELAALEGSIKTLFTVVTRRVCEGRRSKEDIEKMLDDLSSHMQHLDPGDHFKIVAVAGQKKEM